MNDNVKYKFCIISFVAGSRGAYLGYQLYHQYPNYFSIAGEHTKGPNYYNQYDTWHIYRPHFQSEIFFSHPNLKLENLFSTKSAAYLDKTKYNIILTHLYTDKELAKLYDALVGHTVKTIQILVDKDDIAEVHDRVIEIFLNYGHPITTDLKNILLGDITLASTYTASSSVATTTYSKLRDYKNPPDLKSIITHFTQDTE
jgi:hypothetical protein